MPPRARAIVLVVHPDPEVLRRFAPALDEGGFDVFAFNDALDALEWRARGGRCEAIVARLDLPYVNGRLLTDVFRTTTRDLRAVLIVDAVDGRVVEDAEVLSSSATGDDVLAAVLDAGSAPPTRRGSPVAAVWQGDARLA